MRSSVGIESCTGCGACAQKCPKGCISMEPDDYGFLYPRTDSAQCIDCGLCSRVCPVTKAFPKQETGPVCYAANAKNEEIRFHSSSGGVFSLLALRVMTQGGVVFGAALGEDQHVYHIGIEAREELPQLQGSKYIQSEIGDAYRQVESFLKEGRQVLFSGTACQVGGLRAYLGREYDNIYTLDVICHGVPATRVWDLYRAEKEQAHRAKISGANFRSKETGWKHYSMELAFDNLDVSRQRHNEDAFFKIFLRNICLRPSCYQCAYKGKMPVADLTLGDAWGIGSLAPELDDDLGSSVVFLHSEKAKRLFSEIQSGLVCWEIRAEAAIRCNSAYSTPPRPHEHRWHFLKQLKKGAKLDVLVRISELSWDVRLCRIIRNAGKLLKRKLGQ